MPQPTLLSPKEYRDYFRYLNRQHSCRILLIGEFIASGRLQVLSRVKLHVRFLQYRIDTQ